MRTRTCRFLPWLKRFEFRTPLVEASWSYPQFSRQLINAFARPHPLHGHSLKFPGVSLSFHGASFPGNCAQYCVSLQGFTPRSENGDRHFQLGLYDSLSETALPLRFYVVSFRSNQESFRRRCEKIPKMGRPGYVYPSPPVFFCNCAF